MLSYDVSLPQYTMTESQYAEWWDHFRGTGFQAERLANFNPKSYQQLGSHSAEFMAADAAITSALYSCPAYQMIS